MDKKKLIDKIETGIIITMSIGLTGFGVKYLVDHLRVVNDKKQLGEIYDDFNHNFNGSITKIWDTDKPIPVYLMGKMKEESKEHIIQSIKSLDEITTGVNYEIYNCEDENDKNLPVRHISISFKKNMGNNLGCCFFSANKFTGKINYPINITIAQSYDDYLYNHYFHDGKNDLQQVVKHELMHSLGFRDKYEKKEKQKTIMYGNNDEYAAHDYTLEDKYKIQKVYDGKVTVEYPTKLVLFNDNKTTDINFDENLATY